MDAPDRSAHYRIAQGHLDTAAAPPQLWRETLGRALRLRRTDLGLTLAQVSTTSGVSSQYLSEVERGLKDPSSEIIAAIAEVLGLRLPQILLLAALGAADEAHPDMTRILALTSAPGMHSAPRAAVSARDSTQAQLMLAA